MMSDRVDTRAVAASDRATVAPVLALGLLGTSGVAAVALDLLEAPVALPGSIPGLLAITAVIAAVRLAWSAGEHDGRRLGIAGFVTNLVLTTAAILLSPAFGLYLIIGFPEAARLPTRSWRIAGLIGTAAALSIAQVGGPRSELFTPPVVAAFFAITLAIALTMHGLDRRRAALYRRIDAANAELRAAQRRSALLTEQLVTQARDAGIAEERKRLSREIHDTVAQDLVAIISQLELLDGEDDPTEHWRRLATIDDAARNALREARRAIAALASPRLDSAELPLALDDLLGEWRDRTGLGGELAVIGLRRADHTDAELLRVAQEALANVAKHAEAQTADLSLTYRARPDEVELVIADDGRGFDPDAPSHGFGLAGLRARLERLGGTLAIESAPGRGTTLRATLPTEEIKS